MTTIFAAATLLVILAGAELIALIRECNKLQEEIEENQWDHE